MPSMFGQYEILEKLGQGGMGTVYKARQSATGRIVALKILHLAESMSDRSRTRFLQEARAMARLRHRNIVSAYEVDEARGSPYIAMELIEGRSLSDLVKKSPPPERKAAAWLLKIASAVQHAHEAGIIHRDLKPGNIIIDRHDEPMVMDFGLAKDLVADTELTMTGDLVGTPAYMSPEQVQGRPIDARADVFALGAIMYTVLTGKLPFEGSRASVLFQVANRDPVDPCQVTPKLSKDLETICLTAMRKTPKERYQSAGEMAADLSAFMTRTSIKARPEPKCRKFLRRGGMKRLVAGSALLALIVLVLVLLPRLASRVPTSPGGSGAGRTNPPPTPLHTGANAAASPATGAVNVTAETDELVLAGKYDEAIQRCRDALSKNPDAATRDALTQRLDWIQRLKDAATSTPPAASGTGSPTTATTELAQADALLTQGKYNEAIALYRNLLSGSISDTEKTDINQRLAWAGQLRDQAAAKTATPARTGTGSLANGDRLLASHRLEDALAEYQAAGAGRDRLDIANTLIAFRNNAASALGGGQWRPITLIGGERPTLCSIDRNAATMADSGGTVRPRRWETIATEDIYRIYQACFTNAGADEHMGFGVLCVSLGLNAEARQEFDTAVRLDAGKKSEADRFGALALSQ